MARLPLLSRVLVAVPLVAAGLEQLRATVICSQEAQSCLAAAGHGWIGAIGMQALLYALALVVLAGVAVRAAGAVMRALRPRAPRAHAVNAAPLRVAAPVARLVALLHASAGRGRAPPALA